MALEACSILMKILYGARLARLDLLKVLQLRASRFTRWIVTCDIALHRHMCYINWSTELVLCGYVGDSRDDLGFDLHADAEWAGDRVDCKASSGRIIFLASLAHLVPRALGRP